MQKKQDRYALSFKEYMVKEERKQQLISEIKDAAKIFALFAFGYFAACLYLIAF